MTLAPPDLSKRPYTLQVERVMCASADALYRAWTEEFDSWFAAAGTLSMNPEVDALFFSRPTSMADATPTAAASWNWRNRKRALSSH